jgi:hypothetical protein
VINGYFPGSPNDALPPKIGCLIACKSGNSMWKLKNEDRASEGGLVALPDPCYTLLPVRCKTVDLCCPCPWGKVWESLETKKSDARYTSLRPKVLPLNKIKHRKCWARLVSVFENVGLAGWGCGTIANRICCY